MESQNNNTTISSSIVHENYDKIESPLSSSTSKNIIEDKNLQDAVGKLLQGKNMINIYLKIKIKYYLINVINKNI